MDCGLNRIRRAVDRNLITFYRQNDHPEQYQKIPSDPPEDRPSGSDVTIQRFLAGKAYALGFEVPGAPREVWLADPWDAQYLLVTTKELSLAAHKLRARGLIVFDTTPQFARPSDKLITKVSKRSIQ